MCCVYQSNYMAGLRILHADQSDAVPHLTETGFFDGESTLTTPSSIQRTGFGFALCPLQKFVLGSAVQGCPDQLKCTRQLVSARLAGRVQGVSAALFALCRSLFRPKFVWGSLVQVPKEWLGTRCAKSPNKSLLLFSGAWGRPAWVRRQLEQLPLLPLGDCRGDQHGARALRPRPG